MSIYISAFMINFHMGLAYAWPASNMNYLKSEDGHRYTNKECTMVASLIHIGRMFAPLASLTILGKFGRKPPLILAASLMMVSSVMILVYKSAMAIYIARWLSTNDSLEFYFPLSDIHVHDYRFMLGFGIGTYDCFGTIYIGEIVSENVRGIFLTLVVLCYNAGILIQYILAYYLTYTESNTISLAISIIMLVSTHNIVESPYWLVEHNQHNRASKILSWLRVCEEKQVQDELQDIANMERVTNYSEFFSNFKNPEVYKSYSIVLTLGVIASSLMTTTVTFANYIVPATAHWTSDHFAMLLCCIPMINTFLSSFFIDRCGRRPLLIGSFFLETIVNGVIAALYILQEKFYAHIPHFSWIVFILLMLYLVIYSLATYPPILALRSELFPASYKILGVNICICLNAATNFVCTIFFMQVTQLYGMYLNYLVFTVCCFFGMILVYGLLPETKGKTLFEIQRILKGNKVWIYLSSKSKMRRVALF